MDFDTLPRDITNIILDYYFDVYKPYGWITRKIPWYYLSANPHPWAIEQLKQNPVLLTNILSF